MPRLLPITLIALACITIILSALGLLANTPLNDADKLGYPTYEAFMVNSVIVVPVASIVLAAVALVAGAGMLRASK